MQNKAPFEIYDGDLLPKPVMFRYVNANWLRKLFPGRVMTVKPLEDYVKVLDPAGYPMWLTIRRQDRTIRMSHKILLDKDAPEEVDLQNIVGTANTNCRFNRFIIMQGSQGSFIYVISEIPLRERLMPYELIARLRSHWTDYGRGLKHFGGFCRRTGS